METDKVLGMKQPAADSGHRHHDGDRAGLYFPVRLPTFAGWVAYCLLCLIRFQIVAGAVTWGGNPAFAAGLRRQPKEPRC